MAYPVVAPAPTYLWRLTDATATVGTGFVEYFGSTNLALTHSSGSGVTHSPSIILNGTYSYEFGFQDDLQTPNGSPGSANSAFSISFFYKNTSTDPSGTTYLAQGNAAIPANTGWSLSMGAGAVLKLIVGTGSSYSTLTTTAAIPLNTTTYITVTYDGAGNWAVNQNGFNKGTLASAVLSPIVASPFVSIGSEGYAWNVSGYLQDIRVWNSALTIQQDASCYALATMSGPVVVQSNPNQYTTSSTRYATLNSPPSSGSTLFASIRATGNAVTPSGWTSIYLSGGRGLCWKVSDGTETSVRMDSINGTGVTAMMEVAGGNSGSMVVGTNATSSGGTTATANVSVPATNGGAVFSFVASQAAATYTVSDAAPSGQVNFLVNSVVALDSSSSYDAIYVWMTTSEPSAASQPYTDNFTFTTTMGSHDQILIWIPASPVSYSLGGWSATGFAGSVSESISIVPSGVAAAGSTGTVVWSRSAALVGSLGTSSSGSVSSGVSTQLTGLASTTSSGAIVSTNPLTGWSSTSSAGSPSVSSASSPVGLSAASYAGIASCGESFTLTGLSAATSSGSLAVSLMGVSCSGLVGTIVSSESEGGALTGVLSSAGLGSPVFGFSFGIASDGPAVTSIGSMVSSQDTNPVLPGLSATAFLGSISTSLQASSVQLAGWGATSADGSVAATQAASVALTGLPVSSATGVCSLGSSITMAGVSASSASGSIVAAVPLVGLGSTSLRGSLGANGVALYLSGETIITDTTPLGAAPSGQIWLLFPAAPPSGQDMALTGLSAFGSSGTLSYSSARSTTGISAALASGVMANPNFGGVALTGVSATTSTGSLYVSPSSIAGISAFASVGVLSLLNASPPLGGISANGVTGFIPAGHSIAINRFASYVMGAPSKFSLPLIFSGVSQRAMAAIMGSTGVISSSQGSGIALTGTVGITASGIMVASQDLVVSLGGISSAISGGSIHSSSSVGITSASAVTATGALSDLGGYGQIFLMFTQVALANNTAFGLTGWGAVSASGTMTSSQSASDALTGLGATIAGGIASEGTAIMLVGSSAASAMGTLSSTAGLAGVSATTATGIMAVGGSAVALVGATGTSASGVILASQSPIVTIGPLTGLSIASAVGVISTSQVGSVALTGYAGTTSIGSLVTPGGNAQIFLMFTTGNAQSTGVPLTGWTATGSFGALANGGAAIPLVGAVATAVAGSLSNVLVGVAATGGAGILSGANTPTASLTGKSAVATSPASLAEGAADALGGLEAVTSTGVMGVIQSAANQLIGISATTSTGVLQYSQGNTTAPLVGASAATSLGTIMPSVAPFIVMPLVGVSDVASLGSLSVLVTQAPELCPFVIKVLTEVEWEPRIDVLLGAGEGPCNTC